MSHQPSMSSVSCSPPTVSSVPVPERPSDYHDQLLFSPEFARPFVGPFDGMPQMSLVPSHSWIPSFSSLSYFPMAPVQPATVWPPLICLSWPGPHLPALVELSWTHVTYPVSIGPLFCRHTHASTNLAKSPGTVPSPPLPEIGRASCRERV